jgi:hypothetical protein
MVVFALGTKLVLSVAAVEMKLAQAKLRDKLVRFRILMQVNYADRPDTSGHSYLT